MRGFSAPGRFPEYASLSVGEASLLAGPDGAIMARFGWADPYTGRVGNQYFPTALQGDAADDSRAGGALVSALAGAAQGRSAAGASLTTPRLQMIGLVMPRVGTWNSQYWRGGERVLRPGYPVSLMTRGIFWLRFPEGAQQGARVLARPSDGAPATVDEGGYQPTQYVCSSFASPGESALVSTWTGTF